MHASRWSSEVTAVRDLIRDRGPIAPTRRFEWTVVALCTWLMAGGSLRSWGPPAPGAARDLLHAVARCAVLRDARHPGLPGHHGAAESRPRIQPGSGAAGRLLPFAD